MHDALTMENDRTDAIGLATVLATILVSALCYAFILHAGITIAE